MEADIPQFQKCCFYIPLKIGLYMWAAASVIISLVMIVLGQLDNFYNVHYHFYYRYSYFIGYLGMALMLIVSSLHIIYNVVLVSGLCKNKDKLVKRYYNYSKIRLFVYFTVFVLITAINAITGRGSATVIYNLLDIAWLTVLVYSPGIAVIDMILQGYFIIAVRSYINAEGVDKNGNEGVLDVENMKQPIDDVKQPIQDDEKQPLPDDGTIKSINFTLATPQRI